MEKPILVIGEACTDTFVYGSCIRLCPEGPIPVLVPSKTTTNGGMALNVKKTLDSLGASAHAVTNNNSEQISKTRFIDESSNHMFLRVDEADNDYGRCNVKEIDFSQYSAVIISDYNKGFLSEADIHFIGESHPLVFLDTKKILGPWCESVSFIKINIVEYERTKHILTDEINKKLITTMGADGARFRGKVYPVPRVEIKDTSGAGDTFLAALVVSYIESQSLDKAIIDANDRATSVVQKKGVTA